MRFDGRAISEVAARSVSEARTWVDGLTQEGRLSVREACLCSKRPANTVLPSPW